MAEELKEPLLKTEADVESGQKEQLKPTAEENAELVKEGTLTWVQLYQFFANPEHWVVTFLAGYTIFMGLGLVYLFVEIHNFDLAHYTGLIAFLSLIGLSGSAYNAYLAERLKEEVDKYWRLNQRLKSNKARLENTCKDLRANVNKMEGEVDAFSKLRDQMQQFATTVGDDFSEVYEKAAGVLDKMKQQLQASTSNTLSLYQMKLEYADGDEGMTEEEFNNFKTRLPASFQDTSFETISKGNDTASFEDVQALIDRAVQSLGPGAGNDNAASNNNNAAAGSAA